MSEFFVDLPDRQVTICADRVGQITAPTLVAYGRFDGVAPSLNSEAIAEQIPNSVLTAFDGGHPFLWQDRSAWPVLIEFLRA